MNNDDYGGADWEDDEPEGDEPNAKDTVWSILDSLARLALSVTVLILAFNASQLRATVDRIEAQVAKLEAEAKPAETIPADLITEPDEPRVRVDGRWVHWPEGMTVKEYLDAMGPPKGRGETR